MGGRVEKMLSLNSNQKKPRLGHKAQTEHKATHTFKKLWVTIPKWTRFLWLQRSWFLTFAYFSMYVKISSKAFKEQRCSHTPYPTTPRVYGHVGMPDSCPGWRFPAAFFLKFSPLTNKRPSVGSVVLNPSLLMRLATDKFLDLSSLSLSIYKWE